MPGAERAPPVCRGRSVFTRPFPPRGDAVVFFAPTFFLDRPCPTPKMSLQQAKNALVSSLFELSNAANDAAAATVNFYKIAGVEGVEASAVSFANLGETMSNAVKAVTDAIPDAAKANGKNKSADTIAEEDDEKSIKPKKKRAPKDPNAPKKPLTSYLRFNLSVREEMKKERFENGQPCHPAIELNQIIADRWAKLKDSEKEKLQKAWEADYVDYKKAMEKYNAAKPEAADDEVAEEPKIEKKAAPKKKKAKKAATDPVPDYFSEPAEAEEEDTESKPEEPVQAPKKSKKRKDKDSEDKKLKKKKSHE